MSALFPMRWITRILLTILLMSHALLVQAPEETDQQKKKIDKPKFAAIPVPNYNQATGFGLRYMMIPQYRINVGIDFAVGKDDTAFYFRINEASDNHVISVCFV